MDGPLKELAKLEKLTAARGKAPSINDSLESLLSSLQGAKERLLAGEDCVDTLLHLARTVEAKKKEVDERQKEIYSSVARFGKALDKVK